MTRQQAEELTVSAQKYLRMIHFNKIHLVLNMEPLPRKVGWDKRKNKKSEGDKKESEEGAAAFSASRSGRRHLCLLGNGH